MASFWGRRERKYPVSRSSDDAGDRKRTAPVGVSSLSSSSVRTGVSSLSSSSSGHTGVSSDLVWWWTGDQPYVIEYTTNQFGSRGPVPRHGSTRPLNLPPDRPKPVDSVPELRVDTTTLGNVTTFTCEWPLYDKDLHLGWHNKAGDQLFEIPLHANVALQQSAGGVRVVYDARQNAQKLGTLTRVELFVSAPSTIRCIRVWSTMYRGAEWLLTKDDDNLDLQLLASWRAHREDRVADVSSQRRTGTDVTLVTNRPSDSTLIPLF